MDENTLREKLRKLKRLEEQLEGTKSPPKTGDYKRKILPGEQSVSPIKLNKKEEEQGNILKPFF